MARNTMEADGIECRDCHQVLAPTCFSVHRARKNGLNARCRECCRVRSQAWKDANPERVRVYQAGYRKKNAERIAQTDRRHHLKSVYGLTQEQYDQMLADQGGVCAGCGSDDPGNKRYGRFVVDHDHSTGAVRGLLCNPCNVAIGQVQDDISRLMSLAAYLVQHQDVLSTISKEN